MKNYWITAIVTVPLMLATQPAAAAGFEETTSVQSGTFAGARVRVALGGKHQDRKFRAGLTLAPTLRSQSISGETRMRFGQGLELGFAGERPLTFSLAGQPVSRLLPGGSGSAEDKLGLSTGGKVAIGVGVALVVGAAVLYSAAVERDRVSD